MDGKIRKLQQEKKPIGSVGAGALASYIWRRGEGDESRYYFNAFRLSDGRVTQAFRLSDVFKLLQLVRVLVAVIADDGHMPPAKRNRLLRLVVQLDRLLSDDASLEA